MFRPCKKCHGKGYIPSGGWSGWIEETMTCDHCKGSKREPLNVRIAVRIWFIFHVVLLLIGGLYAFLILVGWIPIPVYLSTALPISHEQFLLGVVIFAMPAILMGAFEMR